MRNMTEYEQFLQDKENSIVSSGFTVNRSDLNKAAFNFQKDIITWALEKGKAAILTGCGTGKTLMQRTKALGLLHKQLKKNSCMSRMGIPDYVVFMRKPGENPEPVTHTNKSFPVSEWQEYASPIWDEYNSPVWWDINQSDTLNARAAKDPESERHICPLQLPVIERVIRMYSNKGDTVFTPFLGIGSEVYQAVKMDRKGIGIELKPAYFDEAVRNIKSLEIEKNQISFAGVL